MQGSENGRVWSIIIFSKYFKIQFAWPTFQKRSWTVMTIMSTNRKNINALEIPSMETYLTSIMIRKKKTLLKRIFFTCMEWRTFTQIYSTGVARVPTVVSGAFYYCLEVCNLCKLLFQTQFLSNYPTIIIFYLYNNIPQVNNKCIISCNHLLTCY